MLFLSLAVLWLFPCARFALLQHAIHHLRYLLHGLQLVHVRQIELMEVFRQRLHYIIALPIPSACPTLFYLLPLENRFIVRLSTL